MVELDKKNIEQKLFSSDFTFEDSSVFKELMQLYPWCSSFTVVYLKSLSVTNDMRFPNELEDYAVQLNSREVIYDLLHGFNSGDTKKEEPIENKKQEEPKESVVQEVKDNSKEDELEKLMVSKIISDNLIHEIAEEERPTDNEKKQISDVDQVSFETPRLKRDPNDDDSPKSFNEWLKQGEKLEKENSNKEYLTFEKPKKDFFKPQTSAKESIKANNLPVSETLAKVFESQGNYSMAISIYEQLILIFPEKKIFFANQIEKINNKII